MRIMFQPLTLTIALACISACFAEELKTKYEWKYVDYAWENDAQKQDAIDKGVYDHKNIVPTDFQTLSDGRELLATPKLFGNNPASLSIITNKNGDGGPLLSPFPDWSWHSSSDCSKIISVSRVILDDYNRLWTVDSGKIKNKQVCPAKILQFDADTSELLFQMEIPSKISHSPGDVTKGRLELQTIEYDTKDKFWLYIVDIEGYGLIIFDGIDIWRLDGNVLYPSAEGMEFTTAGENYTLNWGPNAVNVLPPGFINDSYVIIKVLASLETGFIKSADIHASKDGSIVPVSKANIAIPTQEPAKAWTKDGGIMFVAFNTQTAITCWNLQDPLFLNNTQILVEDEEKLQFVPSLKITPGKKKGEEIITILSNKIFKYLLNEMNYNETNFIVSTAEAHALANGTICAPAPHEIVNSLEEINIFPYKTISRIGGKHVA